MVAFTLFGCTQTQNIDTNNTKIIKNTEEANQTIDDIGTDISGLDQTLNEIDEEFGEK